MKRMMIYFALVSIVALATLAPAMLGQNQQYPFPGYPPEFAPSRTSRPPAPAPPRIPPNKFNRASKPVPGEYIVALNEDTPIPNVAFIASTLANAHGGAIKYSWPSLKAFSVRMPEAAAIALSNDPHVLYVEENGTGELLDTAATAWGLDRISKLAYAPGTTFDPVTATTNGTFTAANDGSGVNVYVIDSGIRTSHHQFLNANGSSRPYLRWTKPAVTALIARDTGL